MKSKTMIRYTGFAGLLIMIMMLFGQCSEKKHPRPNILFCITDDQSYEHTSITGSSFVHTPGFDAIARQGVLFTNAFVTSPSCNPSRTSILTGLPFYRLKEASMNHKIWPEGLTVYTDILQKSGYQVGYTGKGCGPTDWKAGGRRTNPAGPDYNRLTSEGRSGGVNNHNLDYAANFKKFLNEKPDGKPFCFWFGAREPHRVFQKDIGHRYGKKPTDARVPPYLPDTDEVRLDLINYAAHIEWFDQHLQRMIVYLEEAGELDNTLIVVTSDNGMAFPRAKASCYDSGTHMPLAMRWDGVIKPGRIVEDFVSLSDIAPTFLQIAGLDVPDFMTGTTLLPVLQSTESGQVDEARSFVVTGLERHFPGDRQDSTCYPIRAIRTKDFLYISNFAPDRWPAGDPYGPVWPKDDNTGGYGDVDGSPSKSFLFYHMDTYSDLFRMAFAKRPAEELYDVVNDPYQLKNIAADPAYQSVRERLREKLKEELRRTGDPRSQGKGEVFEKYARESMQSLK